ncbi:MAG TPA: SpvB/TcaC N-terminal domain-containing protein, partial [Acidimicrobiales bacterium]|nr:SpvB/TcaC N-terminal domain-containing protein [Acidimicrobiales bacterium]
MLVAVVVLAGGMDPAAGEVLGGAADEVAAAPGRVPPDAGPPEELDGLQYGDPAAGIGLIEPPEPDSFGDAQLRYPIEIPPGRLGWQPQIGLAYSSAGDNGWMGVGWDLSLDAISLPGLAADVSADSIEVDTRWGVPRYDAAKESETYLFGGEQLSPSAHRAVLLDRNQGADDRRVFTKRVEADFLRIIRHGTSPRDYWWEVHDKVGNKYFYGGAIGEDFRRTDDGGGDEGPERGHQVAEAVLADDAGNAYWWGLREKWDISSNVVTYFYDKAKDDSGVGDGSRGPKGTQLYLDRINYSGSKLRHDSTYGLTDDDGGPAPQDPLPRWGRYDVSFLRDADLGEPRRPDVTIDAGTGALEVTAQLLRRIDVTYCPGPRGAPAAGATTYPGYEECADRQLVRRYHLGYQRGAFAKTLLRSIAQAGADGGVFATHVLDYHDDVREGSTYRGFDQSGASGYRTWGTHLDNTAETILGEEHSSALGSAKTTAGDGRLFLGFNPVSPDKNVAIGGGLQLGGSDGESLLELLDINGDGLPDLVYERGGAVRYRLNRSGPGGEAAFDPQERTVAHLTDMPRNSTFSVGAGFEAYLGASIMYNHTWTWAREPSYFADVNADGRPDFVDDGEVLFNHLDGETGDISFRTESAGTEVVIVPARFGAGDDVLPDFSADEARQRSLFPLQDTVRRWVAPWSGDVRVTAPVHVAPASPDGVRVAIQRNGAEVWHASIPGGDNAIRRPGGEDGLVVEVDRGDRLYFRVQSVDDGAGDLVAWDPDIRYEGQPPRVDANGHDGNRYRASDDFTLAGRPGVFTQMPLDGRVRVAGVVRKARATTDEVRVVVLHDGAPVVTVPPIAPGFVGDVPVSAELDVRGPRLEGGDVVTDKVELRLAVDSHIDVTALSWTGEDGSGGPQMYYLSATQEDRPVITRDALGAYLIQLHPLYDIDFYAGSDLTGPQGSTVLLEDDGDEVGGETAEVELDTTVWLSPDTPLDLLPATVVLTMKRRGGLVHKEALTIPRPAVPPAPGAAAKPFDLDFDSEVTEGRRYWFDLTTTDPRLAPFVSLDVDAEPGDDDLPTAVRWPLVPVEEDQATVFPQPYRGWAYTGYNGDGERAGQPLHEGHFRFHKEDYPREEDDRPTGFDPGIGDPPAGSSTDPSFKDPI